MAKRAKKTGYKTGYAKYVELYREKERQVGHKYEMAPLLDEQTYQLRLYELKVDTMVNKTLGLLSKKTSVNYNRLIINEALYDSSSKQASAVKKGLAKYIEDHGLDIKLKDIKIKDLRARSLKDNKLSNLLDEFWSDVATAYAEGRTSKEIATTFFDSP